MATVIGVGMQMTANAAGMTAGLSEADKALQLLQKIVEQNQQSLKRFATESDSTAKSLDKLTGGVSILAGIEIGRVLVDGFTALAGAFTSAASEVLTLAGNVSSSLDSLNDLSARTGIGVESLQGYALAAQMAGVDTEAFGSAVQKLAVNIGKATPGDALDKSLRQINLSVAELRALAPEQQFAAIGQAISQLPTAADRAAAAVEIFGKQGAALAPLFREGAASIEELRAKAERLGIIVSETQINNVADMNDAFDLVSATINGIIGQVVGNLAPAVTDVTNQFLKFVEEWSGAQGEGGTGIANAITDVLLQGAEYFAGVFDEFVGNFSGFTTAIEEASIVFNFVANAFTSVTESLRQVFNLFEMVGNGLLLAFGKLLENLGAFFSDNLAQAGRDVAAAASAELVKNQNEFLQAGSNSINAGLSAVGLGEGDGAATARGEGAATAYVEGFRRTLEESRQPEIMVATNIEDVRDRLNAYLDEAGAGASEFLQQSVQTLEVFQQQVNEGGLVTAQIEVMNGFAKELNKKLEQEKKLRDDAKQAAQQQAAADLSRIDSLLKTSDAAGKLEQDLASVERERQRIEKAGGENAQARLEQLDALKEKLLDQQTAMEQGFGQSFQQAFEGADKAIDTAIQKAAEFGEAGFYAAQQLAEGIAEAQRQAEAGIINKEAYDSEVARQQDLFAQRIEGEKAVVAERKKAEQEATQLRLQQEQLVNDLISQQQYNGDGERIRAAQNLVAINAEITRAEEAAAAARAAGDQEALAAATTRIQQLDQVQAKEQDIANGAAQQRELYQNQFIKQQEEAAKEQDKYQQAAAQEQAKIAEARRKAEEAEYARQVARITELNTLGSRTVQTADVRTQEGAALVLGLAANAQDPALIESRLQTKALNAIAISTAKTAANYLGQTVAIVGSAQLG